ncbi:DUF1534 domain-containing protein, partial [Pseudomonas syringae]|nr:DUF1534 domain-containing protein [Pseudomonas syringae]
TAGSASRANAPRSHLSRDAPRHKTALRRPRKAGRRASRNACPRRAREREPSALPA